MGQSSRKRIDPDTEPDILERAENAKCAHQYDRYIHLWFHGIWFRVREQTLTL